MPAGRVAPGRKRLTMKQLLAGFGGARARDTAHKQLPAHAHQTNCEEEEE